jgi:pyruvate dehydrogenase E2 component (dihydrolipoamide acetyltransferase)
MTKQVLVPDIGDAEDVSVIEILVKIGDQVSAEDSLVVLESEKASMEIPSPTAGKIISITISEGDEVDEGDLLLEMEEAGMAEVAKVEAEPSAPASSTSETPSEPSVSEPSVSEPSVSEPAASQSASVASTETVLVPDVGDAKDIVVTEILVKPGDQIGEEDSILVLESDKASMEVPAPFSGEVLEILVAEGAEVSEGDPLIRVSADAVPTQTTPAVSSIQAPDTDTVAPEVRQPEADGGTDASGPSAQPAAETVDA